MSSWSLYWILQLDSISNTLNWVCVLAFIAFVVCVIVGVMLKSGESSKETPSYQMGIDFHRWAKGLGAAWFVALAISTFVPSTKQMAAIVVVPAIVNNQKLQHEASELYTLAKQALVKAVNGNKPTQSSKGKDDANQSQ